MNPFSSILQLKILVSNAHQELAGGRTSSNSNGLNINHRGNLEFLQLLLMAFQIYFVDAVHVIIKRGLNSKWNLDQRLFRTKLVERLINISLKINRIKPNQILIVKITIIIMINNLRNLGQDSMIVMTTLIKSSCLNILIYFLFISKSPNLS